MAAPTSITSILGVTRPVERTWPDGSFECPHCHYPAHAPAKRCNNPACPASTHATPANRQHFQEAQERAEEQVRLDAERRRNHEIAMRRITEDRERAAAVRCEFLARVRAAGGCWRCSDQYRDRIRRHRGACPRERL